MEREKRVQVRLDLIAARREVNALLDLQWAQDLTLAQTLSLVYWKGKVTLCQTLLAQEDNR